MKVIIFIFVVLYFSNNLIAQNDSLWKAWENTSSADTLRLEAYKTFIWESFMFSNPDSAFVLSEDLYQSASNMSQPKYMAGALNHQAVALSILGETAKAVKKYEESLALYLENGFDEKAAIIYSNLGTVYNGKGDFKKAGQYFFRALGIFEKLNDKKKLASAYNNLGVLYNKQKMFDLSKEYHEKSLALRLDSKSDEEIGMTYLNLGSVYGDLKKFQLSKVYYDTAYQYFLKANDKTGLGSYFTNVGHIFYNKNDFKNSLEYYLKALAVYEEIGDKHNVVAMNVHLGGNYDELGDRELALMHLIDGYQKAKQLNIFQSQLESSKLLYELYKRAGEYRNALMFNEEYAILLDSLVNIEQQEKTVNLKFKHEYDKKSYSDSVNYAKSQEVNLLKLSKQEAQIQKDRTQKYALFGGIGLMLIFGGFAYRTYQRKKRDHDVITLQHEELEESHHEIQQSIHYAKRLQNVFLPSDELLNQHFENHFVLFKPKDVVSGDFYWFNYNEANKTKIIAVADCTGHGVPGALVSIVCSNALMKVVKEMQILEPAEILNRTREIVIETFTKAGQDVRDGMDITILSIKDQALKFAGANNGLWLLKGGDSKQEIIEYKANRQPIGWQEQLNPFTQHEVTIDGGDTIYMLTDGYPDQFGGESGKKLKKKALKTFLLAIQSQDMSDQRKLLDQKFEEWRGRNEQIDDVCLMGIRF